MSSGILRELLEEDKVIVSAVEPTGKNRKKVWLQHSDNIYGGEIQKQGYILNNDGTETENAQCFISEYYKVKPNTSYTLSYLSTEYSSAFRIGEYTSSKTFIRRLVTANATYTFTTSATIEYIKVSTFTDYVKDIKIEEGSSVVQDKTYILNDNDVYEEYTPQNEIYSTAETRIGTWIDENGKEWPLYRKKLTDYTLISETEGTAAVYLFDTDTTKRIKRRDANITMRYKTTNVYYYLGLGYNGANLGSYRISNDTSDGKIKLVRENYNKDYNFVGAEITIEYIKTTD